MIKVKTEHEKQGWDQVQGAIWKAHGNRNYSNTLIFIKMYGKFGLDNRYGQ